MVDHYIWLRPSNSPKLDLGQTRRTLNTSFEGKEVVAVQQGACYDPSEFVTYSSLAIKYLPLMWNFKIQK
jgi:hypothetical protein